METNTPAKLMQGNNKIIHLLWLGLVLLPGFAVAQQPAKYPAFDTEAHRGGRALMPENTIAAMKNAIDLGVTGLEMDTHITADKQVVLSHDEYINPLFTLDPEGKEVTAEQGKGLILYKMPYAELKRYDVGSKYYSKFPEQKKVKAYMPLLGELIDSVQNYLKAKRKPQVFYNIETKCSPEGDGLYNPGPDVFVQLLMLVLEEKKILPYVVIQSFDRRTLQIIHQKYPAVRTSYLVQGKKTLQENLAELGFVPFIYSPAYKLVTPELVNACHDKGIKVLPWTVNTQTEVDALKALQVDGVISDDPRLLSGK